MIIGKKSFVTPKALDLLGDVKIKQVFMHREMMHELKVPLFGIYIDYYVWDAFIKQANLEYSQHRNEASGIILGYYLKDDYGEFVVGTHFEAGYGEGTSSVFCEISILDQVRIIKVCKEKNLLQLVWIHSHPSFGAFYSSVDYRTLKSMYYAPHQAGIVVDNIKEEYLGFKVKGNDAYEFKDIYIISLDDDLSPFTRPFGKEPIKIFYAKNNGSSPSNKKIAGPVSLKIKRKNKEKDKSDDIMVSLVNAVNDLKIILSNTNKPKSVGNSVLYRKNWEMTIAQIESLLYEQYGEKPYREVAPHFNIINSMREMISEGFSTSSQAKLLDNLDLLIKSLSKS